MFITDQTNRQNKSYEQNIIIIILYIRIFINIYNVKQDSLMEPKRSTLPGEISSSPTMVFDSIAT